jgi:hypothetical protein
MLYELRTYDAAPGKHSAVVDRFANFTAKAFERHGFHVVGFWTAQMGGYNNQLIYMLAWESYEERERCFAAFRADPERARVFSESEKDGPIVERVHNVMLQPTSFSPLK